jgi:hypothetical protein
MSSIEELKEQLTRQKELFEQQLSNLKKLEEELNKNTINQTPVTIVEPTPVITVEPTPVTIVEPTPVITVEPTPVITVEPVVAESSITEFISSIRNDVPPMPTPLKKHRPYTPPPIRQERKRPYEDNDKLVQKKVQPSIDGFNRSSHYFGTGLFAEDYIIFNHHNKPLYYINCRYGHLCIDNKKGNCKYNHFKLTKVKDGELRMYKEKDIIFNNEGNYVMICNFGHKCNHNSCNFTHHILDKTPEYDAYCENEKRKISDEIYRARQHIEYLLAREKDFDKSF